MLNSIYVIYTVTVYSIEYTVCDFEIRQKSSSMLLYNSSKIAFEAEYDAWLELSTSATILSTVCCLYMEDI